MCSCNLRILNRTSNGILMHCQQRDMYQLLFNNLTFDLNSVEMTSFSNYLEQIDIDYWETEYKHSIYEKKIPIPTRQSNFIILLNRKELEELRFLIECASCYKILKPVEIDYRVIFN
ncbi:DUF6686 family protein [Flavobacterium adhaerens]|uniref:DUF6686 family protein n=1 Tax=Flavobacterium adhaerens TaxID=3149043 RepID=UPI0032B5B2E2